MKPSRRPWHSSAGFIVAVLALCAFPRTGKAQDAPSWLTREQILRYQPRTAAEAIDQLRALTEERFGRAPMGKTTGGGATHLSAGAGRPGLWRELAPPSRSGHALLYDAARDRFLAAGGDGYSAGTIVWALTRGSGDHWATVQAGPIENTALANSPLAVALDSVGDRVIGYQRRWVVDHEEAGLAEFPLADSTEWRVLPDSAAGIPALNGARLACDAAARRVYLVTGRGSSDSLEVWAADLAPDSSWTRIAASPPVPTSQLVSVSHHPTRSALYIALSNGTVYELLLSPVVEWGRTLLSPLHYHECGTFQATLDVAADELLSIDTQGTVSAVNLATSAWRQVFDPGDMNAPCGPDFFAAAVDPVRQQLVVHGGYHRFRWDVHSETKVVALTGAMAWNRTAEYSGDPRMWHRATIDTQRDRIAVHGGWVAFPVPDTLVWRPLEDLDQGAVPWTAAPGPSPRARFGHAWMYDARRDRFILHGGQATDGTGDYLGDLWALTPSDPPQWQLLTPTGDDPGVLRFQTMFADTVGDRLILVGGDDGTTFPEGVWELTFTPDPVWRRLAIAQGSVAGGGWWFDPTRRHAWLFDPAGLRRLTFDGDSIRVYDVPVEGGLIPFTFIPCALDARRNRIVGFPRPSSSASLSSMLVVHLDDPATWEIVELEGLPPRRRFLESAVIDPARDRMILYGGYDDGVHYLDEWWTLSWREGVPTAVIEPVAPLPVGTSIHLAGPFGNPVSGDLIFSCTVTGPEVATLELIDLAGRRVAERAVRGPVAQRVTLAPRGTLRPGVYLARLRTRDAVRVAKAIVTR